MTGKKVFIKTYGCQMNVYDSERMADTLAPLGYGAIDEAETADLVILNTCHIREKASEKVFSELGRLARLKAARRAEGGDMLIAVAGCVAQAEGEEIVRRQGAVDMVFGPQTYHRLPELIAEAETARRTASGASPRASIVEIDFPAETKFDHLAPPSETAIVRRGITAFLTVQEGCDKFCSFCVVPYTRGAESSRPVSAVMEEAKRLASGGVRELTLLGQNVNAYHGLDESGATVNLAGLLARLAEVPEIERLRFTTSHPRDMDDDLVAALGGNPKLMPYLHLPVQSGSDRILKAMNRGHTAADYLALVDRIRTARPDIALSGDLIVGFPGESDADFEATMDVVRRVGYAACYSFKYSPRPGTPAADKPDQVPEDVKSVRLARLQGLLDDQQRAFAESLIGRTMPVLFEKAGRHAGQLVGRSPYLQPVNVMAPSHLLGQIAEVTIESVATHSLNGRLVGLRRTA